MLDMRYKHVIQVFFTLNESDTWTRPGNMNKRQEREKIDGSDETRT